jgi:hypothetical protein
MASPCNTLNVVPIKVSRLVRYSNIDTNDFFLTVESGSGLFSRRSTFGDVVSSLGNVTGSYSGSFSGSHYGSLVSKNTNASGSFSGSHYGSLVSKNTNASGSFSGSYWGRVISKNTNASGSFSGSHYGSLVSKNTNASGSFSGSHYGSLVSKNTNASGSFSGSHYGSLVSKNTKATGSFSGVNNKLSGSFSGSSFGRIVSKNGLITGSFRGIDNITNFKGTGKKVSFNGTASYSISSSHATTSSYVVGGINDGFGGLNSSIYSTSTSPSTLNAYKGSSYSINHGFTTTPSLIRVTLICEVVNLGYSINDEISVEQLHDDTGGADDERPITTIWSDATQVGIALANWSGGVYAHAKSGGRVELTPSSWKIKIRTWK